MNEPMWQRKNPSRISLYAWIAKGLILRSSVVGYKMLDEIIYLLSSTDTSSNAAKSFSVILQDDTDGLFGKDTWAKTFAVFKQRFFLHCKKPLMDGFLSVETLDGTRASFPDCV